MMLDLTENPWPMITPIGDAECLVFMPGGIDAPSSFLCTINATGEFWEFTQYEVRRSTNITEGRTRVTPFSVATMQRFAPMRAAARAL